MQRIFCLVILMLSLGVNVWAIQCYSCESIYYSSCGDDFDLENHFKLDCSRVPPPRYLGNDLDLRNATGCMKRTYKVGDLLRIERSCFFGDMDDMVSGCQLDPVTEQAEPISCNACDNEDFCNKSSQQKTWPHYLSTALFVFTVKLLNWLS